MGWNGSGQKGATPAQPKKVTPKKPSPIRGLVAGAVVVTLAVVAYFAFFAGSEKPQPKVVEKERGRIKEVTPAAAPTNKVVRKSGKDDKFVYFKGKPYPRYNEKGCEAYVTGYGVRYHAEHIITSNVAQASLTWAQKLFKRTPDRVIALYLTTEPGTFFVGDLKYGPNFTKQFLKTCEEPIEILPTDTDEEKEVKQAVIETRKELLERYKKGEDPAEIIQQTREDLKALGAYKQELTDQLNKLARRADMTEKDLDDYVAAANEMLESRGCTQLAMPSILRRSVQLREKHLREAGINPHDLNPNKTTVQKEAPNE